MGKKSLKLGICRVIATTMQSCLSKNPSDLPKHPHSSLSPLPPPTAACALPATLSSPQLNHTYSSHGSDYPPEKNRRRAKKKMNIPSRLRLSTSSADTGWFSSDGGRASAAAEEEDEEIETLVSSSSELHPIRETQAFTANPPHRRSRRSLKPYTKRAKRGAAAEGETPARLSMFKKLIPCTVEGKVKESFAIVKRSEDPYSDFKRSMMDMIVEKQMFEQKELEQLLQCFLSLNSTKYHGIIVQAFSDIWAAIFSPAAVGHCRRRVASF